MLERLPAVSVQLAWLFAQSGPGGVLYLYVLGLGVCSSESSVAVTFHLAP